MLLKENVDREEIVEDLSFRFFTCFLRTKTRDLLFIKKIVARRLPKDYKISRENYIRTGVEHPIMNEIFIRLSNFFGGCRRSTLASTGSSKFFKHRKGR